MTPQEVLDAAADLLERDGWCQNAFSSPDGSMCISTAIRMAGSDVAVISQAFNSLFPRLGVLGYIALLGWNDAPSRALPEVLAALRGPK